MKRIAAVVSASAFVLAGCAQFWGEAPRDNPNPPYYEAEDDMAPTETETPATAETVPAPQPRPRPRVTPSDELAGDDAPDAADNGESAPETAETATEMPDFSLLIGRDFTGVEAFLGPADRVEEVAPGRNWEYRDGPCLLVVRFYPDLKTLDYRVLSYSFDNEDSLDANDESCRNRFAARVRADG